MLRHLKRPMHKNETMKRLQEISQVVNAANNGKFASTQACKRLCFIIDVNKKAKLWGSQLAGDIMFFCYSELKTMHKNWKIIWYLNTNVNLVTDL